MDKALYVREMFAEIAPRYDATNKILTAGADEGWRKRAVAELAAPHGGRILDLCCGTGDLAFHLARTDPSLDVTLLAPICPHTLTQRPLIVPAHLPLSIQLNPRRAETPRVLVSLDGRPGCELKVGDEVRVRRAETPLRLLLPPGRSFFEVARRKLKWGRL